MRSIAATNNEASADAIARGDAVAAATVCSEQAKLLTPGSEPLAGRAVAERFWRRNRRGTHADPVAKEEDQ
jgi:hypothetical protein